MVSIDEVLQFINNKSNHLIQEIEFRGAAESTDMKKMVVSGIISMLHDYLFSGCTTTEEIQQDKLDDYSQFENEGMGYVVTKFVTMRTLSLVGVHQIKEELERLHKREFDLDIYTEHKSYIKANDDQLIYELISNKEES